MSQVEKTHPSKRQYFEGENCKPARSRSEATDNELTPEMGLLRAHARIGQVNHRLHPGSNAKVETRRHTCPIEAGFVLTNVLDIVFKYVQNMNTFF